MSICKVTVLSKVDGQEQKIVRMGRLEERENQILLSYREENAAITLLLTGTEAKIDRVGDYALSLYLKEGETQYGKLEIGGNVGQIPVASEKIRYAKEKEGYKIELRYRLLFGEESQDMELCIYAQTRRDTT